MTRSASEPEPLAAGELVCEDRAECSAALPSPASSTSAPDAADMSSKEASPVCGCRHQTDSDGGVARPQDLWGIVFIKGSNNLPNTIGTVEQADPWRQTYVVTDSGPVYRPGRNLYVLWPPRPDGKVIPLTSFRNGYVGEPELSLGRSAGHLHVPWPERPVVAHLSSQRGRQRFATIDGRALSRRGTGLSWPTGASCSPPAVRESATSITVTRARPCGS